MHHDNDFESPGYEYLRLFQNMNNLYHKLVILNYQRDFCSLYKCPPIHKYYFSIPNKNMSEQQFLFTCLCAWLIKDKCQMNIELEPEEYDDPDVTNGLIIEALQLLLTPEDESNERNISVGFPTSRLRQGFGPEVIWTMNVFADNALDFAFKFGTIDSKNKIVYGNGSSYEHVTQPASFITIGQPFVGGGLTTRPLGSYLIDDTSLLFPDDIIDEKDGLSVKSNDLDTLISKDWHQEVERSTQALESARLSVEESASDSWRHYLKSIIHSSQAINNFINNSKATVEAISNRIDQHLQTIIGRETHLQTSLNAQLNDFLKIYRGYSSVLTQRDNLIDLVNLRTDKFESHSEHLKSINSQIEKRVKELNDGTKLKELESMISKLKEENNEIDVKIGLLLTVYSKIQTKIVSVNV